MTHIRPHPGAARATRWTVLALALALSACGGGGGNPGSVAGSGSTGTGTTTAATPTVTLAFADAAGQASSSLSGATPLTARATVRDAAGKPVANALVAFATDNTLAVFSPSAGTALTDANGVASVTVRAASLAAGGAATVSATSTVAGTTVSGGANYAVGATALTFGTLSAAPASIQAYGSTVLSVDLLAAGAKYTDQQVNVHFSSACVAAGKATLAATVATNGGTAQAVYRDQGCANNDVITVAADGVAKSASAALAIAAPAPSSVQFVAATPVGQSIVIQGQGGINRTETATLKFKVIDIFGNALAGKQVNFSVSNATVRLNKTSDSTDQNGEVITTVNSGSVATTFRVQATLPGTAANGNPDISTTSDSIVVSTGLPVQRAFSLSAENYNLEGWNRDSSPTQPATQIQVMLGDAFGNPVPDGTPVVFQTNMGSVGSSSKGGCNTVNGGCSVDFRTQNPRVPLPNTPATPCNTGAGTTPDNLRAGLATVCASSTDGTNAVFAKIGLFFGGSSAANVFLDGGSVPLSGTTDLGTVKSADPKVFQLQLNDVNLNPLPVGTKVEVTNLVNATAGLATPSTVPDIFPHSTGSGDDITGNNVSGPQGSFHRFSITSLTPNTCTQATTATFNVTVTTPGNVVTNIPFKLTFSCP